jgi:pyrimidine operon attenuation protein/uracil phosphoribosyltransferase
MFVYYLAAKSKVLPGGKKNGNTSPESISRIAGPGPSADLSPDPDRGVAPDKGVTSMKRQRTVLTPEDIERALTRMAYEIIEAHKGVRGVALAGILKRGDTLAKRLQEKIHTIEGTLVPVGAMDINLYRDDWTRISHHPTVRPSRIDFSVDEKTIVLVDDVLFTGRTIRAAMDAVMDFGRPSRIELAVLVDRGHRELPIQADYRGITLATLHGDMVNVCLIENDGAEGVFLEQD